MKRRKFIKQTGTIATVYGLGSRIGFRSTFSKLNVGLIGSGLRGQEHLRILSSREDCNIVAIADPDSKMLDAGMKILESKGRASPKPYGKGAHDYLRMMDTESLDLVIIATPWRWHTEMAKASLERHIYTGLEVSGAIDIQECWELVHTVKNSKSHVYFLENVCFRRDIMAVLNMVRRGLFGELIHLEGGYQHDLRGVKFNDGKTPYNSGVEFGKKAMSEARWRTQHSVDRNGDLYPTHGVGPLAQFLNINKGNRFLHISSYASKSRGLHDYIINHEKGGEEHPNAQVAFRLGDKITSLIKCVNGETIVLHHDTNLPRPYSLGFRVQGTKGLWMAVNKSIYIEGLSPAHAWEDQGPYMDRYDHTIWKQGEQKAIGAGHGGMDYFLVDSLVTHAKNGTKPPFDAYDAASWKAITPLSEASIVEGGTPQDFPDFTEGDWKSRTNTFALDQ